MVLRKMLQGFVLALGFALVSPKSALFALAAPSGLGSGALLEALEVGTYTREKHMSEALLEAWLNKKGDIRVFDPAWVFDKQKSLQVVQVAFNEFWKKNKSQRLDIRQEPLLRLLGGGVCDVRIVVPAAFVVKVIQELSGDLRDKILSHVEVLGDQKADVSEDMLEAVKPFIKAQGQLLKGRCWALWLKPFLEKASQAYAYYEWMYEDVLPYLDVYEGGSLGSRTWDLSSGFFYYVAWERVCHGSKDKDKGGLSVNEKDYIKGKCDASAELARKTLHALSFFSKSADENMYQDQLFFATRVVEYLIQRGDNNDAEDVAHLVLGLLSLNDKEYSKLIIEFVLQHGELLQKWPTEALEKLVMLAQHWDEPARRSFGDMLCEESHLLVKLAEMDDTVLSVWLYGLSDQQKEKIHRLSLTSSSSWSWKMKSRIALGEDPSDDFVVPARFSGMYVDINDVADLSNKMNDEWTILAINSYLAYLEQDPAAMETFFANSQKEGSEEAQKNNFIMMCLHEVKEGEHTMVTRKIFVSRAFVEKVSATRLLAILPYVSVVPADQHRIDEMLVPKMATAAKDGTLVIGMEEAATYSWLRDQVLKYSQKYREKWEAVSPLVSAFKDSKDGKKSKMAFPVDDAYAIAAIENKQYADLAKLRLLKDANMHERTRLRRLVANRLEDLEKTSEKLHHLQFFVAHNAQAFCLKPGVSFEELHAGMAERRLPVSALREIAEKLKGLVLGHEQGADGHFMLNALRFLNEHRLFVEKEALLRDLLAQSWFTADVMTKELPEAYSPALLSHLLRMETKDDRVKALFVALLGLDIVLDHLKQEASSEDKVSCLTLAEQLLTKNAAYKGLWEKLSRDLGKFPKPGRKDRKAKKEAEGLSDILLQIMRKNFPFTQGYVIPGLDIIVNDDGMESPVVSKSLGSSASKSWQISMTSMAKDQLVQNPCQETAFLLAVEYMTCYFQTQKTMSSEEAEVRACAAVLRQCGAASEACVRGAQQQILNMPQGASRAMPVISQRLAKAQFLRNVQDHLALGEEIFSFNEQDLSRISPYTPENLSVQKLNLWDGATSCTWELALKRLKTTQVADPFRAKFLSNVFSRVTDDDTTKHYEDVCAALSSLQHIGEQGVVASPRFLKLWMEKKGSLDVLQKCSLDGLSTWGVGDDRWSFVERIVSLLEQEKSRIKLNKTFAATALQPEVRLYAEKCQQEIARKTADLKRIEQMAGHLWVLGQALSLVSCEVAVPQAVLAKWMADVTTAVNAAKGAPDSKESKEALRAMLPFVFLIGAPDKDGVLQGILRSQDDQEHLFHSYWQKKGNPLPQLLARNVGVFEAMLWDTDLIMLLDGMTKLIGDTKFWQDDRQDLVTSWITLLKNNEKSYYAQLLLDLAGKEGFFDYIDILDEDVQWDLLQALIYGRRMLATSASNNLSLQRWLVLQLLVDKLEDKIRTQDDVLSVKLSAVKATMQTAIGALSNNSNDVELQQQYDNNLWQLCCERPNPESIGLPEGKKSFSLFSKKKEASHPFVFSQQRMRKLFPPMESYLNAVPLVQVTFEQRQEKESGAPFKLVSVVRTVRDREKQTCTVKVYIDPLDIQKWIDEGTTLDDKQAREKAVYADVAMQVMKMFLQAKRSVKYAKDLEDRARLVVLMALLPEEIRAYKDWNNYKTKMSLGQQNLSQRQLIQEEQFVTQFEEDRRQKIGFVRLDPLNIRDKQTLAFAADQIRRRA